MSVFSWFFGHNPTHSEPLCMKGRGRFQTEVTDCDLFQRSFERICAGLEMDSKPLTSQATLVEMPYDPRNRHPVQVEAKGLVIGHLNDRDAKRFLHQLHKDQDGNVATCPLRVVFHPEPAAGCPTYTARLDLPD